MTNIHEVAPREVAGRDMILRVNMQHQAAAYAALEVLEGGEVDRIYCDYHDDFVVRHTTTELVRYHFFQVKTKGKLNKLWSLAEVFALKKRGQKSDAESLLAIKNSFAGRLIAHSIAFRDACGAVTLLSNAQFLEEVEELVQELRAGTSKGKGAQFVRTNFDVIFGVALTTEEASRVLAKLSLEPGVRYVGQEAEFAVAAREAIFQYSEIDLEHHEAAEIASDLVAMVNRKSITSIASVRPEDLDKVVGVGLADLLAVLSISPAAYSALKAGEDPKALKTASFIQRKLKTAGATDQMVEFASQKKVAWDIWLRENRHVYADYDLNFLLQMADDLRGQWMQKGGGMQDLRQVLQAAVAAGSLAKFPTLNEELLFGGVIAAYVRKGTA